MDVDLAVDACQGPLYQFVEILLIQVLTIMESVQILMRPSDFGLVRFVIACRGLAGF